MRRDTVEHSVRSLRDLQREEGQRRLTDYLSSRWTYAITLRSVLGMF